MIAALLLLAAPDPQEPHTTRLVHRDGRVEIVRDGYGVPHVFAPTWRAAFWGQGYAQAQDRLWQMELLRRSARARSAEMFGRGQIEADLRRLQTGYTQEELEAMLEANGERFRTALREYAEGVNAFLREEHWPLRYREVGSEPVPWSPLDSLAIGIAMARRFGESGDDEVEFSRLYRMIRVTQGEDAARQVFDDILPADDPLAPTTLGDEAPTPPTQGRLPPLDVPDEIWARRQADREALARDRAFFGWPSYAGSNAWAVAPSRSASGRAMLFGGPMMGFGAPSVAYENHLVCPEFEAYGMSFPGTPAVLIGFNRHHAWTTTSGGADLVDTYELRLNPDDPEQYWHDGAWRDFERVETTLRVFRIGDQPVVLRRCVYGPVTGVDAERHRAYATAYAFRGLEAGTFAGFLDFNFAASLDEFRAGVAKVTTSHNILYADVDGHIAFWYAGRHPIRAPGHDPRFLMPGDGTMDWQGFLPFERIPQVVDPPRGWLANWNNKPCRSWTPGAFGRVFWGRRIFDRLDADPQVTFDECGALAREAATHSWLADYFLPRFLDAIRDEDDDDSRRAVEWLSAWDLSDDADSPAPLLFWQWSGTFLAAVFRPAVGPLATSRSAQQYLLSPLFYLLEGDSSPVALHYDWLDGRDGREVCRQSFHQTMEGMRREYGDDPAAWRRRDTVDFGDIVGEVPSPRTRGTYKIVVEMTTPPRAVSCLPPGQNEDFHSPHYRDQVDLFVNWQFKPAIVDRSGLEP